MYLEQNNYNKETVKEVQTMQKNVDYPIINGGYPTFNTCDHTTLDMSHLQANSDNYQHTLSIKIAENRYVTVCVMKTTEQNEEVCLDVKFYDGQTRIMGMENGRSNHMEVGKGLTAIINEIK